MSQPTHSRLLRLPKQEKEVRIVGNPSDRRAQKGRRSASPGNTRQRLIEDDYQAPQTATGLRPNSKWLIVRRNVHRIRFMGHGRTRDNTLPPLYLSLQMKRELKRAQEEIKNIDKEDNFTAVKSFALAVDERRTKMYDTSHVKPEDALTYDRLGEEPLPLQNLLFYFSKQEVPHGTMFWDFLNAVNCVLNMNRKRTVLVERLRKLALTLSIICYTILGCMLFLLIISVITTATKMNDPEVRWLEPEPEHYDRPSLPAR